MALRIDRVQLQFEIQPDCKQQELRRLEGGSPPQSPQMGGGAMPLEFFRKVDG